MEEIQLHNNDRKLLAEHFKGKQFNDKLVFDFCKRNKIAITDAGSVEDFIYQIDYDERVSRTMTAVLQELANIQYAPEYISEQSFKEISDFNDNISANIAQILEDNDIQYREMSLLQSIAQDLAKTLNVAERRVSNMCATVLAELAQEKLGDPLTIKVLAKERSQIADRKDKKLKKELSTV